MYPGMFDVPPAKLSRSRTPTRRSPSPARTLENGLTRLSLGDSGGRRTPESKPSGAVSKTWTIHQPLQQDYATRLRKIRHPTDPLSSRSTGRAPQHYSLLNSAGDSGRKKKTLSFSETHLVSSTSSLSPRTLGSNGSLSGTSSGLASSGRRIHIMLPSNTAGGLGGPIGTDATPDNITTPESLKGILKTSSDGANNSKSKVGQQRTPKKESKFQTYMQLNEVQQGLKRGELLEGVLRINPKNYQDAYITAPDGPDIYLGGIHDRNRALNGDVVVVKLKPMEKWKILLSDFRNYLARNFNYAAGVSLLTPYLNMSKMLHPVVKTETVKGGDVAEQFPKPEGWDTWDKGLKDGNDAVVAESKSNDVARSKVRRKRGKKKRRSIGKTEPEEGRMEADPLSSSADDAAFHPATDSADLLMCGVSESDLVFDGGVPITGVPCEEFPHLVGVSSSSTPAIDPSESSKRQFPGARFRKAPIEESGLVCADVVLRDSPTVGDGTCLSSKDLRMVTVAATKTKRNRTHRAKKKEKKINRKMAEELVAPSTASSESADGLQFAATPCESPPHPAHENDEWNRAAAESQVAIIQLEDFLMDVGVPTACNDDDGGGAADFYGSDDEPAKAGVCVVPPHELSEVEDSASDSASSGAGDVHLSVEDACLFVGTNDVSLDLISWAADENVVATVDEVVSSDEMPVEPGIDCALLSLEANDWESGETRLEDLYFPGRTVAQRVSHSVAGDSFRDEFLRILLEKLSRKNLDGFTVEEFLELPNGPKFVQRTAQVVYVLEHKNPGFARGYLKPMKESGGNHVLFTPTDHRMPCMKISLTQCPSGFLNNCKRYAERLYVARLASWTNDGLPSGLLIQHLDNDNFIKNETEGILYENNIEFEFMDQFCSQGLPKQPFELPWSIPKEEIEKRTDFRQTCVFTVDPKTARDLDDALSCEPLGGGLYRVGVHIADVSYFVPPDSELDRVAARMATSVYLVQMVVPMLPRVLCENLCSLNPGEDRLAFSVVWLIREDGAILEEWFGRSVIRSCVKMSYDSAQQVIDAGSSEAAIDLLPPVFDGWKASDVAERVLALQRLAVLLRKKRAERGFLRLDQVKLGFHLDPETGMPAEYFEYVMRDSNRLIEEFMLLANMAVAHRIYKTFPKMAVLRRHPPPQEKPLEEVVEAFKSFGMFLDPSSSSSLQRSMNQLFSSDHELAVARSKVISVLLSIPMTCALYFCSGCVDDTDKLWHYALNVPLYTHFTSPIRRYPDILVHRLLAASLGLAAIPSIDPAYLQKQLSHCNDKKLTAKRVSDLSSELFLAIFIKNHGQVQEVGMVCRVLDRSFNVLVLKMGIVRRIGCEQLPLVNCEYREVSSVKRLILVFRPPHECQSGDCAAAASPFRLELTQFSIVSVILTASGTPLKINATLGYPVFQPDRIMAGDISGSTGMPK